MCPKIDIKKSKIKKQNIFACLCLLFENIFKCIDQDKKLRTHFQE